MIRYEWVIETVDAHGDIQDVNHADSYAAAQYKLQEELGGEDEFFAAVD